VAERQTLGSQKALSERTCGFESRPGHLGVSWLAPRGGGAAWPLEGPYESVSIRARLDEHGTDGAEAHIDHLARKYLGRDVYRDHRDDDPRILLVMAPEAVVHHGGRRDASA
jgi:hypothetical protein